jgi:hypothetical protein
MSSNAARRKGMTTTKDILHGRTSTQDGPEVEAKRARDTAQYIADMILELRNMARSAKLFQVMVPLEYAYYEAFSVANRVKVAPEEVERIRELERVAEESDQNLNDY